MLLHAVIVWLALLPHYPLPLPLNVFRFIIYRVITENDDATATASQSSSNMWRTRGGLCIHSSIQDCSPPINDDISERTYGDGTEGRDGRKVDAFVNVIRPGSPTTLLIHH